MHRPDPDQPDRRRLEVTGNFKEPPHLGMTIRDGGCNFDSEPPKDAPKNTGGRPAEKREKAEQFIHEVLTKRNGQIGNDLAAEWEEKGGSEKTFWRAADAL